MRPVFVKGETGGLTASALRVHRALTWEAKDLSSTLSLSLGPAWSKDLPLSGPPLLNHLVNKAAAQCGWRASWPCGGPAAGVSASALGPTPVLPPPPQPGLLNPQEPMSLPRAERVSSQQWWLLPHLHGPQDRL